MRVLQSVFDDFDTHYDPDARLTAPLVEFEGEDEGDVIDFEALANRPPPNTDSPIVLAYFGLHHDRVRLKLLACEFSLQVFRWCTFSRYNLNWIFPLRCVDLVLAVSSGALILTSQFEVSRKHRTHTARLEKAFLIGSPYF